MSGLGGRGKAIYAAYGGNALPPGHRALVLEYARCADTLDKLHALAGGDTDEWAKLVFDDMGDVTLEISGILAERRQQQQALMRIEVELRQLGLKQTGGTEIKDEDHKADVISILRTRQSS